MLTWMLGGLAVIVAGVVYVIRNAENDDKTRKLARKGRF